VRLRRCAGLWFEPRESSAFDLDELLAGGSGVVTRVAWLVHAPHLDAAIEVDAGEVAMLGGVSPEEWIDGARLRSDLGDSRVRRWLRQGLLVGRRGSKAGLREADDRYRQQHWHGLAAQLHARSRWHGEDAVQGMAQSGTDTAPGLRERHGPPPPVLVDRGDHASPVALPRVDPTAFDRLLDARSSCRNFDRSALLPMAQFARVMWRAFGARAVVPAAADFEVLKKAVPSGGAMHPTEAYVVVQRVEGLEPGLYHYRPVEHALAPMPRGGAMDGLASFARVAVAGQQYFADAQVLVVLAPRFARNFWKYRDHAKAYRVCILDVGHLSQTLFLSATEQGLGAFITAAINEVDIEQAFGLTGYVDGPLAVCGFGLRADRMTTPELDPNHKAWPSSR